MISTSTTSMMSTALFPNSRPNSCVPSTSGQGCDGPKKTRQERFNRLREYIRRIDHRADVGDPDPYKRFIALCRKYHGQRTKKGHSFRARKLRWLWYKSGGRNGPFEMLWDAGTTERTRHRNDELAISVRCLSGGFTQAETEAVIRAWGEHNGEGYDYMARLVYRATSLARALEFTKAIREQHQKENAEKYWSKTANRILWALQQFKDGGTPKQIAAMVDRDVDAVKHRLATLFKSGQVEKVKRGFYRLVAAVEEASPVAIKSDVEDHEEMAASNGEAATVRNEDNSTGPHDEKDGCDEPLIIPEELSQEAFVEYVLKCRDLKQAEMEVRQRFYRQAKDYAESRSNRCPMNLDDQLAAMTTAWYERHGGSPPDSISDYIDTRRSSRY
jgi:hypothetical protein